MYEYWLTQMRSWLSNAASIELSNAKFADYCGSVAAQCLETAILYDLGDYDGKDQSTTHN